MRDGRIVAAAQEERFTRIKHDARFPKRAVSYCLEEHGLTLSDIDWIVFYEKPFLKFERLLETYLSFAPRGFRSFSLAMPLWIREKLFLRRFLLKDLTDLADGSAPDLANRILFAEHHQSHAASAFYPSPFSSAAVLTMDGVGEWATTTIARGENETLETCKEIHFPHSLGLLYSAFTYYTGFRVNSGEYKLMGLAPYGEPRFTKVIRDELIDVKADGSFRLNMSYFDYSTGLRMTNRRFHDLFAAPPRQPESEVTQRVADLAASVQVVVEDVVLRLARSAIETTAERNLCLAGGVALNAVANGKLIQAGIADEVWIQPASGDAGGAIGAALVAYHLELGQPRRVPDGMDGMAGAYLGPRFDQGQVASTLKSLGARFDVLDESTLVKRVAVELAQGAAVGWFQGRMEFGPRALGNRSILTDPRQASTKALLNEKIKRREGFRPFAPAVTSEASPEWFELVGNSPYMLLVAEVSNEKRLPMPRSGSMAIAELAALPSSAVPAVTHVDYSARLQTVHKETNPRFHALLVEFQRETGCPILLNTSFNVRGEPIVCTPEDAWNCFMSTDLDVLVIENCLLEKSQQPPTEAIPSEARAFRAD